MRLRIRGSSWEGLGNGNPLDPIGLGNSGFFGKIRRHETLLYRSNPAASHRLEREVPLSRKEQYGADLRLVRASLEGDDPAVQELAQRLACIPRIVGSLNRSLGFPLSDHDAADLSQDVVVAIWRKRATFNGKAKLETWVYRFCFLEMMNHVRKKRHRVGVTAESASVAELPATELDESQALESELLERSLQDLGPPQDCVIRLKHYEDLTFKEIANLLDLSPNTVKAHYYRGIEGLRQKLHRHHREADG